jgi:NAD-dependent dihydropyrimidine dehydrogenase PreA subunit
MPAKVDVDLCTGCHDCEEACPNSSVRVEKQVATVNEDDCIECAACVDACTTSAMKMTG